MSPHSPRAAPGAQPPASSSEGDPARRAPGHASAARVELAAMVALLLSYIWLWQDAFAGSELLVTALYFGIGFASHVRRGESARQIGLRLDNLGRAARVALPVAAVGLAATLGAGALLGSWSLADLQPQGADLPAAGFVWLVLWGTAQQYGLACFFYRRLREALALPAAAAAGAGLLFALFHLPNPLLTIVTLVAGCVSCALYRREPNVFVLGLLHAAMSFTLMNALPRALTHGLRVGPGFYG